MMFKNNFIAAGLIPALALTAVSCSSDDGPTPETAPKIELSRAETVINDGINDFGFDFFTTIANDEEFISKNPNFAVSPVSMAMLLSMCANSLDDSFRDRICERMGAENLNDINTVCSKLMTYLPAKGNKCDMTLANSVWHRPVFLPSADYKTRINDYFEGAVEALDFTSGYAADEINSWASRRTGGVIKEIVKDDELKSTILFLANAMYFKSDWSKPFDVNRTAEGSFHSPAGDRTVKFMNATRATKYGKEQLYDFATLNYSGPYQFVAIRPAETATVAEVAASLTNESLTDALDKGEIYDVVLSMPKFESEAQLDCNKIFGVMNLNISAYNLYGFNPVYDWDEDSGLLLVIKHFSKVSTDEKGTVAAAVSTGNNEATESAPKYVDFTLDRPFLYLIRNTVTGSIIMMGQVTEP